MSMVVGMVGGACGARSTLLEGETLPSTGGAGTGGAGGETGSGGQSVGTSGSGAGTNIGGSTPTTTSTEPTGAKCPSFGTVKTLGGSGQQRVHQVEFDSQGNLFVRGAYRTYLNLGTQTQTPSQSWSWFLAKLGPNLTLDWVHTVDGCDHFESFGGLPPPFQINGEDQPMAAVRVSAGYTCDFGAGPITGEGGSTDYVVRFSSTGEPLSQFHVPGQVHSMASWPADNVLLGVTHHGDGVAWDWFNLPAESSAFLGQVDPTGNLGWAAVIDTELTGGGYTEPTRVLLQADQIRLEGAYFGAVQMGDKALPPTVCTYYSNQGNCQTWMAETFGALATVDGEIVQAEVPAKWLTGTPGGGFLAALPTPENNNSLDDIAYFAPDNSLVYQTSFLPDDGWNGVTFSVTDRRMDLTGQVWVVGQAGADFELAGQKVQAGTFWVVLNPLGEISCVGDFGGATWQPSLRLAPDGSVWFSGTFNGPAIINGEQVSPPDQYEELLFLRVEPPLP